MCITSWCSPCAPRPSGPWPSAAPRSSSSPPPRDPSPLTPTHKERPIRHSRRYSRRLPKRAHRINREIRAPRIRVVDDQGEQLGVMTTDRAMLITRDRGLDLVELVPDARPPVCRITDYGKLCYELAKKKKASRSRSSRLKEIRLRPKTDDHDLETKLDRAKRMLAKGDRVRLVMRLRGRERGLVPRWKRRLRDLLSDLPDTVKVAGPPKEEGRSIALVLEPANQAA